MDTLIGVVHFTPTHLHLHLPVHLPLYTHNATELNMPEKHHLE